MWVMHVNGGDIYFDSEALNFDSRAMYFDDETKF